MKPDTVITHAGLDPQEELAALVASEEPVEERGADASDVEKSGRARGETNSGAHAFNDR